MGISGTLGGPHEISPETLNAGAPGSLHGSGAAIGLLARTDAQLGKIELDTAIKCARSGANGLLSDGPLHRFGGLFG